MDYNELYYTKSIESEEDLSSYNKEVISDGILAGMNLFVIQAEALSDFVVNLEYDGIEITPYLNEFINDENVFYFVSKWK